AGRGPRTRSARPTAAAAASARPARAGHPPGRARPGPGLRDLRLRLRPRRGAGGGGRPAGRCPRPPRSVAQLPGSGVVLSVRDFTVHRQGRLVLDALSFEVPDGAALAVLGPNGAGKSTLLEAVAGLLPAVAGSVELDGRPLERLAA